MIFLLLFSNLLWADELKIVGDPWCPFTCAAEGDKQGIIVDVSRAALKMSGHELQYQTVNWSRAIEGTRKGEYQLLAGALKQDAPDLLVPKTSYVKQKSCFFTLPGSKWDYKGQASLSTQKIGLVQDYAYGEPFDTDIKKISPKNIDPITGLETAQRLIEKLLLKRSDVIIEDHSVIQYSLNEYKAKHPKENADLRSTSCLKEASLYALVTPSSANSKKWLKDLDKGIDQVIKSGEIQKIFAKYGLKYEMKK